jgi:hypothetical protein
MGSRAAVEQPVDAVGPVVRSMGMRRGSALRREEMLHRWASTLNESPLLYLSSLSCSTESSPYPGGIALSEATAISLTPCSTLVTFSCRNGCSSLQHPAETPNGGTVRLDDGA